MSSSKKISFLSFLRLVVIVVLLTIFPLLSTRTYAVQPDQGNWTLVGLSAEQVISVAVDPTNKNILYVGTGNNGHGTGVFKSTDGGTTWFGINNGLPVHRQHAAYQALAIDPSSSNVIYVGVVGNPQDSNSYQGIFKSTNGGISWVEITPTGRSTSVNDIAIDPLNTNTIYISASNECNGVWKSTDGGVTWTLTPMLYCDTRSVEINPTNSNILYTTNGGRLLKSTNAAATWSEVLSESQNGIVSTAIDPFTPNVVYAGSGHTGIYKSTDSGVTWTLLSGSPKTIALGLRNDTTRVNTFYAASNNTSYQTANGGVAWSAINTGWPGGDYSYLLHPSSDPNVLYAGNYGGGVYVYGLPNQAPQISMPSNATINEGATYSASGSFTDTDSASWSATVNYGDGTGAQPLSLNPDKTFSLSHLYKDNGTYTVTVTVTDNQGASDTETATVTVNNVAPTVGNITVTPSPAHINEAVSASASFTDPGVLDTHTATLNWGDGSPEENGTVTESNGSGSVTDSHTYTNFGTYTVTLTVKDKDNATGNNTTTITVVKQITVLNPAEVWLSKGLLNIGLRLDVLAEAYKDNTLVSSGQLNSVQVGSGGFGSANLINIPFNSFSPVDFPQGSQLKLKLSVRNACSGSLPNQGTARIWFNDSQANSHFGATIGTTNNNYFLRDNFLLATIVGTGPRENIDVQAGAKCSPLKPFGTWAITP